MLKVHSNINDIIISNVFNYVNISYAVYKHGSCNKAFKDGMEVNCKYVKRKLIHQFVSPETLTKNRPTVNYRLSSAATINLSSSSSNNSSALSEDLDMVNLPVPTAASNVSRRGECLFMNYFLCSCFHKLAYWFNFLANI